MFTADPHMALQGVISVAIKELTLNGTVVCEMFSSAFFFHVFKHDLFPSELRG